MLKKRGITLSEDTKLLLRYILVGSWNMIFGITVFTVTYLIIGSDKSYILVAAIAHPIGVAQSHFTQRKIVWKSESKYLPELFKFGIVQTQGFVSTLLLMMFFIEILELSVIFSQIIGTIIVTIVTFILMKYWTFAKKRNTVHEVDEKRLVSNENS
jgi:putative flippase GtrA